MAVQSDYRRNKGGKNMRIIYKLNEDDIAKILADHFDALPEEVKIGHRVDAEGFGEEPKITTEIEINTVQE